MNSISLYTYTEKKPFDESRITFSSKKMELATRITGHSKAPKQSLECVFEGAILAIEEYSKTKFDSVLKERVWNKVSTERIKSLRETLLFNVCIKMFDAFKENEVDDMLEEHKRTGIIRSSHFNTYAERIHEAYRLNHSSIEDSVAESAKSMEDDFVLEIDQALRDEGIELPVRTKK